MSETTLKNIINLLKSNNIEFVHFNHEPVPKDSLGASKVRGLSPDSGAKALILQGKSGKFYQTVLSGHLRLDIKKVKNLTSEKNISLASPNDVLEVTGCVIGTVPPMGVLFNIPVYIDHSLLEKKEVVFSAGTRTDTIRINPQEFVKINKAIVADISKQVE
ncbi:YbaK/EbsC family protein [Candidatus Woesearchaeota archaeon]|nr:YbaK/EbsC family protein [Candidatus Woesearchaeota archaeon]